MKIICPLGFDLHRDANGIIHAGSGTKLSCDRAVQLALHNPKNSTIVVTAGNAGSRWCGTMMSGVMAKYIKSIAPEVKITEACADSFNTFGEMKKLAQMVSKMHKIEIVLAVKNWHAPRAKFLLKFWLWKYGCNHPVSISTYPQPVPSKILLQEYIGAWPKNIIRVAQNLFRKVS